MSEPTPRFSVIVPVFEGWHMLPKCLAALARQTVCTDVFEVIVVNNQPDDQLDFDFAAWTDPPFRFIGEARNGSYAARNAGIEAARGEFLCFTDADCIPNEGWLEAIGLAFDSEPDVARVGGDIRLTVASAKPNICELYETMFILQQRRWVENRQWAATANLAVRRDIMKDVGPFNAKLLSRGDREWGEAARARGYRIVFSEKAFVEHPARATLRDLATKSRRGASGYVDVYRGRMHPVLLALKLALRVPFRAIPSPRAFWTTIVRPEGTFADRVGVFALLHYLRIVQAVEAFRLYFFRTKPERR